VFQGEPAQGVRLSVRKVLARVISRFMPPHHVDDVVQETYVRLCHATGTSVATSAGAEFDHFCGAVRLLPLQTRRVLVLKKVYGYSQGAIAEELNLSASAVEDHIAAALARTAHPDTGQSVSESAGQVGGIAR